MAIERNLFFANGNAYDIQATMGFITELYDRHDEETFPEWRYESIISVLTDFKYLNLVDSDTLISDVWHDLFTTCDLWFADYGIVDHRVEYYVEALGNDTLNAAHYVMGLFQEPLGDIEMEEHIEQEPEDDDIDEELHDAIHILAEINAWTQDLEDYSDLFEDSDDE